MTKQQSHHGQHSTKESFIRAHLALPESLLLPLHLLRIQYPQNTSTHHRPRLQTYFNSFILFELRRLVTKRSLQKYQVLTQWLELSPAGSNCIPPMIQTVSAH